MKFSRFIISRDHVSSLNHQYSGWGSYALYIACKVRIPYHTPYWYYKQLSKMNRWLVIAFALTVASFSEGKSANLVLLTDAPTQSVS